MIRTEYDDIKINLIKKSLDQNNKEVVVPVERRKKKDAILQFINLICIWLWAIMFIILALIIKAGEDIKYIMENQLLWLPIEFWEVGLLKIALYITVVCICVCTFCIILNMFRNKRRTDRIKRTLIICEIVTIIVGTFLVMKLY